MRLLLQFFFIHVLVRIIRTNTPRPNSVKMELFLVHLLLALCSISFTCAQRESLELLVHPLDEYPLPNLPFGYEDLEPFLDTPTLKVHHLGHHKAYTDKMNAALRQWREKVSRGCGVHANISYYINAYCTSCMQ